ncbi:MAG: dephospho-CoA kinase [Dechloromonas sp.]|uniref:Dephospho-CoA kinase n=1 Tax=Candidatus Dechloromonas phosphorivorans TaxID=2899244 RepID=A0A935KC56_9RHOO|nr:dephospho-CoA kinase [Candidatus Dechloromonas phosphorivorans]
MSGFVVGLTGGIGSGKSTVADLFVVQGAALVDTDVIAHQLTAAGGAAMPQIVATFGHEIADAQGALDRVAMRRMVFTDSSARGRLEAILHPLIRQISDQRCAESSAPYVILAVPLLVESGSYSERCDRIAVVDCPETVQISRVMARNGLSENEVRAILKVQASREQRLAIANEVIDNGAGLTNLYPRVAELHLKYLALSSEKAKANC